jgi:alanyl-tRNA synthetase
MRQTGDMIKDRMGSVLVVLGAVFDGQANFVAMLTPDLVDKKLHAGNIVKQVAQAAGGRGGGRAEMGQGGGRDSSNIDLALGLVKGLVEKDAGSGS